MGCKVSKERREVNSDKSICSESSSIKSTTKSYVTDTLPIDQTTTEKSPLATVTTERIVFEPPEPDDEPLDDIIWPLFNATLQHDSPESAEEIVAQILPHLPTGDPESIDWGTFYTICFWAAELMPPDHPSMEKLAEVMYLCLKSPQWPPVDGLPIPNPWSRYGNLGMEMRIHWNCVRADDVPTRYTNFQAFLNLIDERLGLACTLQRFVLQGAFEDARRFIETPQGREASIFAAMRNLVQRGHTIYEELKEEDQLDRWRYWSTQLDAIITGQPIVLMQEAKNSRKKKAVQGAGVNRSEIVPSSASPSVRKTIWRLWFERFRGARPVRSENSGTEKQNQEEAFDESVGQYRREMVEMAHRARATMEAIEVVKNAHSP